MKMVSQHAKKTYGKSGEFDHFDKTSLLEQLGLGFQMVFYKLLSER